MASLGRYHIAKMHSWRLNDFFFLISSGDPAYLSRLISYPPAHRPTFLECAKLVSTMGLGVSCAPSWNILPHRSFTGWLFLEVLAEISPPPRRSPPSSQSLFVTSPRFVVFTAATMIGNDLARSFVWYLSHCRWNMISEGTETLALIYWHRPSARTWPST